MYDLIAYLFSPYADPFTQTARVLAILFVLFLPNWIAVKRRHPSRAAITILNIALGWTVIGWLIALIWSATGPRYDQRGYPVTAR